MDAEDFVDVEDGNLVTRAPGVLWCQSYSFSINSLQNLNLKYVYSDFLINSEFSLQIKFKLNKGDVLYDFKFKDARSHNFKQSGLNWWSTAFDKLDNARANRSGNISEILIFAEGNALIFSINGFRFVKIHKTFNPSDIVISLTYPITNTNIIRSKEYCCEHINWNSLFSSITFNRQDINLEPSSCYIIDLNNKSVKQLSKVNKLSINTIKNESDLRIRDVDQKPEPNPKPKDEDKPKPKPKDDVDKPSDKEDGKKDPIKPDPKVEKDDFKNKDFPDEPKESVTINEKRESENTKLKSVERFSLTKTELKEVFDKALEHYIQRGFSKTQAELIIFQMGVSFCTSKNSVGDMHSHFIWQKENGNYVRIRKCEHVKMLLSLVRTPCNVERALLRQYSSRCLELLKEGKLVPGWTHAKKRGFKEEFAYLACDFIDPSHIKLSEEEKMAINSAQNYVLLKNKHKRSIVNVNQLW
nr:minor coat protein [chieh-qua chlorotic virus]WIA47397.1 minor coat protein [chieh-qua chlorotic virus]